MRFDMLGAALAATLVAMPTSAETVYLCRIHSSLASHEDGKYNLILVVEDKGGVGGAIDGATVEQPGGPKMMLAKVRKNTDRDLWMNWTFPKYRFKGSYVSDLNYRAKVRKSDGSLALTVVPVAYPSNIHYKGDCVVEKKKTKR